MREGRTRSDMRLTGMVSSGLGRAHIFMAQDHYQEQFKLILGDVAWPGTLNVQVSGEDLVSYVALRHFSGVDTLDIDEEIKIPRFLLEDDKNKKRNTVKKQCKYYGHGHDCLW